MLLYDCPIPTGTRLTEKSCEANKQRAKRAGRLKRGDTARVNDLVVLAYCPECPGVVALAEASGAYPHEVNESALVPISKIHHKNLDLNYEEEAIPIPQAFSKKDGTQPFSPVVQAKKVTANSQRRRNMMGLLNHPALNLTKRERDVWEIRFKRNPPVTHEEISRTLKISKSNSRTMLAKAFKKLRDAQDKGLLDSTFAPGSEPKYEAEREDPKPTAISPSIEILYHSHQPEDPCNAMDCSVAFAHSKGRNEFSFTERWPEKPAKKTPVPTGLQEDALLQMLENVDRKLSKVMVEAHDLEIRVSELAEIVKAVREHLGAGNE